MNPRKNVRSLTDSKALVTGAGKRIGQALAIALAREGCDVVVHYNKSKEGAEKTVATIQALGRKAEFIGADLSLPDAAAQLAKQALRIFGNIDILINNASPWPTASKQQGLLTETIDDWHSALSINAQAPFFLIQHLANQSRLANVVNILDSSVGNPFLARASHSIAKSALAALTIVAAKTLYPRVRVNALELGTILKPDEMTPDEAKKAQWTPIEKVIDQLLWVLKTEDVNGQTIKVGRE